MTRRYVIVGSSVAGVAAVEAIRQQDSDGEIVLLDEEPYPFYSRPGLAYLLTGEIPEEQLFPKTEDEFKRLKVHLGSARVEKIETAAHQVTLVGGRRIGYDRLLLATGSMAVRSDAPGSDLAGVVKLDNLEDVRGILKLGKKARAVVVVGGGITALEIVEGLRARGLQVHYFLRGDRYWGNVLDETESQIVEGRLKEEGVEIHYHTELAEILGRGGKVTGVLTKDGQIINCGMVAIAIGVKPRKELAAAAGIQTDRGIGVDPWMKTSVEDIYAAGDVAQVFDTRTGVTVLDTLWWAARDQGQIAGLNMAGVATPYQRRVPMNVTRLAGLTTTIIGTVGRGRDEDMVGIARGDSETWRQLPDAIAAQSDFDVNRLRVMVAAHTLVGAVVMGDQTLSQPLYTLISQEVDITPVRDTLLVPGRSPGDTLTHFYTQWRTAYAAQQS